MIKKKKKNKKKKKKKKEEEEELIGIQRRSWRRNMKDKNNK